MFEILKSTSQPFQVFYFSAQAFDRTIGQLAVIDAAGPEFLDPNEGIDDGVAVFIEKDSIILKDRLPALHIYPDQRIQLSGC